MKGGDVMNNKVYFDQVAPYWDRIRRSFFTDQVREKAYKVAGVQAGRVAADLGTGTGFIAEGLIKRGLRVIAVDQSEAMLTEMQKKLGSERVDYRVGGAEKLPISAETVDYAFANMYLHHVESPPHAIKEMARILKPGGKLVITDLDSHTFDFLRTEQQDRWMGFQRPDVRQWLIDAGLKNVTVDCAGEQCCADSCDGTARASVGIFIASGEK